MRFDGDMTLAELVAAGLSPGDAAEVRAFAVWLRRNPRPADGSPRKVEAPDFHYALGEMSGLNYLRNVVPAELPS